MFSQWNPGCVERVKKIRDYAFVHFTSRDDAVLAMDHLNGTEVEGSCVEVTLAKPVDKEQYSRQKASKGASASPEAPQQNFIYQCDPYTLAYYGYPYNTLIGPNRDYFVKGENASFYSESHRLSSAFDLRSCGCRRQQKPAVNRRR